MEKIKLWEWNVGRRENAVYYKFPLWYFKIWKFGWDAYIIKFKAGEHLDWHTDIVPNGDHWRLNITLTGKNRTALSFPTHVLAIQNERFISFRPDIVEHSFTAITNTELLSFGFVKFK